MNTFPFPSLLPSTFGGTLLLVHCAVWHTDTLFNARTPLVSRSHHRCFTDIPVPSYLIILSHFSLRLRSWFLARLLVHFSTSTALWWMSALVPLRGVGEAGFKPWSVPSSSPDPLLPIASRMNHLNPFLLFMFLWVWQHVYFLWNCHVPLMYQ